MSTSWYREPKMKITLQVGKKGEKKTKREKEKEREKEKGKRKKGKKLKKRKMQMGKTRKYFVNGIERVNSA